MTKERCAICSETSNYSDFIDHNNGTVTCVVTCENCGQYELDCNLYNDEICKNFSKQELALIRHRIAISKHLLPKDRPLVSKKWLDKQLEMYKLPNPKELRDNFIIWLAEKTEIFGVNIDSEELNEVVYELGAFDYKSLVTIIGWCQKKELINKVGYVEQFSNDYCISQDRLLELTLEGWEYYESIKNSSKDSKLAFMAMPFGKSDLDEAFKKYWKPAAEEAEFNLERLDENQKAGSIDDRLRQKIRRSAFLVCELTEGNKGAYWEAGFAEGIGIPVIYTCREDRHKEDSHFDVNHHLCIIWNNENLEEKKKELTAIIRETLI